MCGLQRNSETGRRSRDLLCCLIMYVSRVQYGRTPDVFVQKTK